MPTVIITVSKDEGESSVGGIVAGVTISLLFVTVVTVVGVIGGVWLWRRCILYILNNII